MKSVVNVCKFIAMGALFVQFSITTEAQSLISGAESVAYHPGTNSYYVSSLNSSKVIKIDENGNQTLFKEGVTAFGNCIKEDILYLASGAHIRGFNVFTAEQVFDVVLTGAQQLDGMTYDNSGFLFVVESIVSDVYKVNLTDGTFELFIDDGMAGFTQDLIFDEANNRILACAWEQGAPVKAINLDNTSITDVSDNSFGRFDGIALDNNGFIYLSTHLNGGQVIMYDSDFSISPVVISTGHSEPAGLDYNLSNRVLAVPNFAGNNVDFIDIPEFYLYPGINADLNTGHAPLEIQFNDLTLTNETITSWAWDFDSDGTVDSQEQNPEFIFTDPGFYTVSLKVTTNSSEKNIVMEQYIEVFDGKSALLFNNEGDYASIPSFSASNLTDKFSIEFVINPRDWGTSSNGLTVFDKGSVRLYVNGFIFGPAGDYSMGAVLTFPDGKNVKLTAPNDVIQLDTWQHVAFSYDATINEAKMYINGLAQAISIVGPNVLNGDLMNNENDDIYVGNNYSLTSDFIGAVDEFRLWNVVRTGDEIEQHMNEGLSGNEGGLIGYWKMNEGNGTELFDNSPNSNNGILVSGVYTQGVDLSVLTDLENKDYNSSVVGDFMLEQNFPNPFNPSTKISFTIPENSEVKLLIYDLNGSIIITLVDNYFTAGSYSVTWNGWNESSNSVSSGVYFYRIVTNDITITKKMILLR